MISWTFAETCASLTLLSHSRNKKTILAFLETSRNRRTIKFGMFDCKFVSAGRRDSRANRALPPSRPSMTAFAHRTTAYLRRTRNQLVDFRLRFITTCSFFSHAHGNRLRSMRPRNIFLILDSIALFNRLCCCLLSFDCKTTSKYLLVRD